MLEFKGNLSTFPEPMKQKVIENLGSKICLKDNWSLKQKLKQLWCPIKVEDQLEFNNFCDLVERMLIIDPQKWIKPSEALKHEFFKKGKYQLEFWK